MSTTASTTTNTTDVKAAAAAIHDEHATTIVALAAHAVVNERGTDASSADVIRHLAEWIASDPDLVVRFAREHGL